MFGLLTGILNVLPLVIHAIGSAERLKRPGSDKKAVRQAVSSLIDSICLVTKVIETRERSDSTS